MTEKPSMDVKPEDITFLRKNAYVHGRDAEDAWVLLENYCDQSAEMVATQYMRTQLHRDGLRNIAYGVINGLRKAGFRLEDPEWKVRFQECLNQASVDLNIDIPHDLKVNRDIDRKSYYAQCIEYIRCAAYFVRTDLSKNPKGLTEEARLIMKAQAEILENLLVSGYLQCDLRYQ